MNSHSLRKAKSIRFRRWSRAGYAIFCSLACTVTIGCVAVSISDKSLQKSNNTTLISVATIETDAEAPDEQQQKAALETALLQIQESTLLQTTTDSTVTRAGQAFTSYIFYSL